MKSVYLSPLGRTRSEHPGWEHPGYARGRVLGKACDDRAGCAVPVTVLEELTGQIPEVALAGEAKTVFR